MLMIPDGCGMVEKHSNKEALMKIAGVVKVVDPMVMWQVMSAKLENDDPWIKNLLWLKVVLDRVIGVM